MAKTKSTVAGERTQSDKWSIWLSVTNAQGVVFERLDLTEYNLDKPLAQASLIEHVRDAAREANISNIDAKREEAEGK